ncbi:hypothetical protein EVAR_25568_1 [Eumeta japonica]|uniref:Uncharacterized protein n=1 Tax=Eumeta variegata TaxID=151549 RepID=A0A4C1Z766_EUMVA|nr:hypothetical protein EVAR_25568_1 [Eumeta japonica]
MQPSPDSHAREAVEDEVFKEAHEQPWTEGHFGLTKALGKLRERYFVKNAEIEEKNSFHGRLAPAGRRRGAGGAGVTRTTDPFIRNGPFLFSPFAEFHEITRRFGPAPALFTGTLRGSPILGGRVDDDGRRPRRRRHAR